jgi:hypothetical protein
MEFLLLVLTLFLYFLYHVRRYQWNVGKTDLTAVGSPPELKRSEPISDGYGFYRQKYTNFQKHVETIADYNPKVQAWSQTLSNMDFAVFLEFAMSRIDPKGDPKELIQKIATEESFDLAEIQYDHLDKLERYIELFQTLCE